MAVDEARAKGEMYERELMEFLTIPSISTLPAHAPDCRRAAEWLAARLHAAGLEHVEIIEDGAHPLVYADWLHAAGMPTILLYGHYDVQPVDPLDEWDSPPFQPTVRNGFVYARGATDDKGQVMTLVAAADACLEAMGRLPVNLRFLFEGEEESGGGHIKRFLAEHPERVRADFAQVADTSFFAPDVPSIDIGLRGIVYTEVYVRGTNHDLHSGEYGGVAPNALISLARLIARLRDEHGHVTIPGFYDAVEMPPQSVCEEWRALQVTAESIAQEIGARAIIGDPQYTPLERMWAQPTLDVHGISGGFTGEGAKTVIPARASAKISMRLVPNQRAAEIFQLFTEAVYQFAPEDIVVEKVEYIHGDDPVVVPGDTPEIDAARHALSKIWGKPAVLTRSGGSIPVVGLFQQHLGIPTVLLGFGLPGANLHAPNEHFSLDQFHKGIEANILFWELVSAR
jgi:acetylornithine deacetylase/succinyl-diaminopimelate desuccinylase-like protein